MNRDLSRPQGDHTSRFAMHGLGVRGAFVRLVDTWQAIRLRNEAPHPAQQLLGEAVAATALLASRVKIDGRLSLQLQGDSQLKLLMAECTSDGSQRGVINCAPALDDHWQLGLADPGALLSITIENARSERYQGIVQLAGSSLADALVGYFEQSEQLDTRIWLAADNERAAGLIVQRLPERDPADPDGWNRVCMLAETITLEELLSLPSRQVGDRLFAEEQVSWEAAQAMQFRCPCSRERVAEVLRALGREELEGELQADQEITVDCEFCNEHYSFDAVDLRMLFESD
ncbi:MAG: Hsp33 family molecular chaperone HslO [Pseudomonadota bacterium]